MPRRKKERNCNEIKVECRCDNMNMWSWSLRNILNINVRHLCYTYSPFQYPPSIQTQRKGFSPRLLQSAFYTRSSCILQSAQSDRFFLYSECAVSVYTFWFLHSKESEFRKYLCYHAHGEERSEPQDFELCSCFALSLGNSLYSILTLKPWAHALDLRSFYSRTKLKKWRHNKHTVFFLNKFLPWWKIGGFGDLRNEVRSGYGLMGYVSIL